MADETLSELRQALDDAMLTRTGRSIGDLASQRVLDDIMPYITALQPAQPAEPRAIVQAFALAMERKLAANDDKGGFRDDSEWNHVMYAKQEMKELKQALAGYRMASLRAIQLAGFPDSVPGMESAHEARTAVEQAKTRMLEARQAVLDECADVANYVMFAAGVIGALPPTDERGR